MSQVIYNGVVIDKARVRVQRRAVMCGPQTLYWLYTLHVEGVYNPGYITYKKLPNGTLIHGRNQIEGAPAVAESVANLAAAAIGGQPATAAALAATAAETLRALAGGIPIAPQTERAVREALRQPRKRLVFSVGNEIVLDVPKPPLTVDLANGPTPISNDVVEIDGLKTFMVEFVVSCAVNEVARTDRKTGKPGSDGSPGVNSRVSPYPISPLLAHEWTREEDISEDFFSTITTTGRAVFRSDILAKHGLVPDQCRYWISHPVMAGYNRHRIWVKALPDGLTLEYLTVDRQRTVPYDPNILTRFEAVYTREKRQDGLEEIFGIASRRGGLLGVGVGIAAMMVGFAPEIRNGLSGYLPEVFGPGGNPGGLPGMLAGIPTVDHHLTLRGWGHPTRPIVAIESELLRLANDACDEFDILPRNIPVIDRRVLLGAKLERTTYDLAGKFVEYHLTVKGSLLQALSQFFRPAPGRMQLGVAPVATNARPILTHPMRGTNLAAVLARSLRDSTDAWDQPATPPNVTDVDNPGRQSENAVNGVAQP